MWLPGGHGGTTTDPATLGKNDQKVGMIYSPVDKFSHLLQAERKKNIVVRDLP